VSWLPTAVTQLAVHSRANAATRSGRTSNTCRPTGLPPSIAAHLPARLTKGWTLPQRQGQMAGGSQLATLYSRER
jgi:hypothetical protein